jgi:hypothetical protein
MPRCRFVDPTRVSRLSLSADDWIEIHYELSVGQIEAMVRLSRQPDGPHEIGALRARLVTYLVGWSLLDQNGHPAPLSPGAVAQLEVETLNEINAAIEAHEAEVLGEKKRWTTGANAFTPILQSVGT